ncbi:MAG: hypothetical protein K6F22_05700 [Prevotella sp.]|nr:hypothetical protein [Prevotella sp.]
MAQSDARFGYYAKLNREDHDLSQPFGFTTPPGSLCPIFTDIATPGDTYYINHDLTFLRTMPLAAPAMVDVEVHFESFFVPFQMIYQPFEDTMYQMKSLQSKLYNLEQLLNQYFPLLHYENTIAAITAGNDQDLIRLHQEAFRLADFFGLQADNFCIMHDASHTFEDAYQPNFFPWKLLAYQCIFQYYYRLDDKSSFDNIFNFDDQYNQAAAVVRKELFKMHQRPWDFDYYTSIYRSPIVSDASMQVLPTANLTPLTDAFANGIDSYGAVGNSNVDIHTFSSNASNSYVANVDRRGHSTAAIRQMFAAEKFAMITGRARKTYDSQVLAHFGVSVPHDPKHDIALIGQDHYPVHIGEVTSLASTEDAPLGDLAGKGWAQGESQRRHKFTAPCHGVVMTIFSIEPKRRYYGGFDRDNTISRSIDIPTPENDRLGNIPMFRYESGDFLLTGQNKGDIIGWKERFYPWKRKQSKTTLAFSKGNRFTGVNNFESYMIATFPYGIDTYFTRNSRPDLESRFYIEKNCMDSLMLVKFYDLWKYDDEDLPEDSENWDKSPHLVYARDPFIVDSYVKVKKVSWMSKDGEPIYPY